METRIPAIKLSPQLIFPLLDLVDRSSNDPSKMREEIVDFYRKHSTRSEQPSEKNIVRAVTLPSLRHIDVIEGVWPKIILNPNGVEVLGSYRNEGVAAAKRKLGTVIYRVDLRKCSVIQTLDNLTKSAEVVKYDSVLNALASEFNIEEDKGQRVLRDRLKRWLLYLEYVDFVTLDGNTITVRKSIIESASKKRSLDLSIGEFTRAVLLEYERLLKERKGDSVYISIPELRDAVCKRIPGMLKDEFYDYFKMIKFTTGKYSIMLSEPMMRQEGGVRVGDKYYYYISIYKRR